MERAHPEKPRYIRDIMSSPVVTVTPETSIQEIARLMREHAVSAVPVVTAAGKLVGIITEIDLIARHAPPKAPQYIPLLWGLIPLRFDDYANYKEQVRHILAVNAEQLMTRNPATVRPDDTIERAAELMIKPGHRSLPVMDGDKLVGIVTRTDLVRLIEDLEASDE
ncbi:MAG: CBS domain-containing protein [Caldilineae bacterium]|nr:MAG: CBS domain-containing protein [Caldilineae bacterium]